MPGSRHDYVVRATRIILPAGIGVLVAFLSIAPLTIASDMSFVLDKNKVDVARERMRATEALYRGEDSRGRPFSLRAGSAVQQSSSDPVVKLSELSARMLLEQGPAVLHGLQQELDRRLAREGRTALAQACFDFLPHRAALDLAGWPETDIFAHV